MAVIGSVIIAFILIVGTFWSGKNASTDTEKAGESTNLAKMAAELQQEVQKFKV